jgi:gamma-glutamylcyclotransferase (GGCT)/AIG2-like uncharacterized protein YtfP
MMSKRPAALFTYGSLMFESVWRALVRVPCASMRARLPGFRRERVAGASYPGIVPDPQSSTLGRVYFGLDAEAIDRLDQFEGNAYARTPVEIWVETARGARTPLAAEVYVLNDAAMLSGEPWRPEVFERESAGRFFEQHAGETLRATVHQTPQPNTDSGRATDPA